MWSALRSICSGSYYDLFPFFYTSSLLLYVPLLICPVTFIDVQLIPPVVAPKLKDLTNHLVNLEDSEGKISNVKLSLVDGSLAFYEVVQIEPAGLLLVNPFVAHQKYSDDPVQLIRIHTSADYWQPNDPTYHLTVTRGMSSRSLMHAHFMNFPRGHMYHAWHYLAFSHFT